MQAPTHLDTFEIRRQLFHIALGVMLVFLLMYGFIDKWMILVLIFLGFLLSYASLRMRLPVISSLLETFERERELRLFPGKGTLFYFIGAFLALLLFPKDVAMASILVLAFGDAVSHFFGLHYGRTKHPLSSTKFLEGTFAGFLAGFVAASVILPWQQAIFASLSAMIVEALEVKIRTERVDDNVVVPLAAGLAVQMVRLFSK